MIPRVNTSRVFSIFLSVVMILSLLLGSGAFPTTVRATGTTRLVAMSGTDSGDCSSSPCTTITYAISQAVNGDTIEIGHLPSEVVSWSANTDQAISRHWQNAVLEGILHTQQDVDACAEQHHYRTCNSHSVMLPGNPPQQPYRQQSAQCRSFSRSVSHR